MPSPPIHDFPLFPLGIVALPGERVPLHIFEERYKSLIAHCLEFEPGDQGRSFGILWLSEDELKHVGCSCEVEQVLEQMDDGRLNILTRGMRALRLIERRDDREFPSGIVEFLDDEGEQDEAAGERARDLYRDLVLKATERKIDAEELADMDAYEIAGTIEFPVAEKQQLLELRSEGARMRLLCAMLTEAIKRLSLADIAEVRARSNGHVWYG
jgi:Lon protease-like protein